MNKRLLGIFIAVAVAVVVIVVCCVMFLTGSVEVRTTDNLTLEDETVNAIITQSGIRKGESVFAIDESEAVNAVEKANPTLKVVDIERKFPNKVVIYIAERTPLMAIAFEEQESGEKLYAVVDNELKILKATGEDGIVGLTVVDNFTIAGGEDSVGSFVGDKSTWLAGVVAGAQKVSFVSSRFTAFVKSITFGQINVSVKTNTGVTLVLKNVESIDDMFVGAYTYYSTLTDEEQRKSGFISLTDSGWMWSATAIN